MPSAWAFAAGGAWRASRCWRTSGTQRMPALPRDCSLQGSGCMLLLSACPAVALEQRHGCIRHSWHPYPHVCTLYACNRAVRCLHETACSYTASDNMSGHPQSAAISGMLSARAKRQDTRSPGVSSASNSKLPVLALHMRSSTPQAPMFAQACKRLSRAYAFQHVQSIHTCVQTSQCLLCFMHNTGNVSSTKTSMPAIS